MIQWIADIVGPESWALPWIHEGMICAQDLAREAEGKPVAFELKNLSWRPARLDALGCGGWDARGILRAIHLDFDVGHGSGKNAKYQFASSEEAIAAARRVRELVGGAAEIRYSKSGVGIHVRIAAAGEIVNGRASRKSLGVAAYAAKWIAAKLALPIDPTVNGRQNLWFWAAKTGARGFEMIEACAGKWSVPDDARTEPKADAGAAGAGNVVDRDQDQDARGPLDSSRSGVSEKETPDRARARSAGGAAMGDFDRAALYIQKAPPVGEGGRNKALFSLCYYLVECFNITEDELQTIAAPWAAACSPAMQAAEARETIRSAFRSAAAKGAIGSKWTAPKVKGQGRAPIAEPGGLETQIDLPDDLPQAAAVPAAAKEPLASNASSSSSVPADPAGLEMIEANAPRGEIDRLFKELSPHAQAAAAELLEGEGETAGELADDQVEAENYFDKKFEDEVFAAARASALARDGLVRDLFRKLARFLPCMEAATVTRVRASVCRQLQISRGDFNQVMRQSRSGEKSESNEVDFVQLGRAFLKSLKPDQALLRWREDWYYWTRTAGVYCKKSEGWLKKFAGDWLIATKIPVSVSIMGNFRLILEIETFLDDNCKPGQWLGEAKSRVPAGVYMVMGNGILNLEKPELPLLEHSPDYWAINGVTYPFDPKATCPKFDEALIKWQAQANGESWAMQILQDWSGYCLDPGNREQKFLLNKGDGNDAKSTYAHILTALVGEQNVGGCGLEAFDPKKNFGLMPLLGKTLNITGDATHVDRISEGMIKSITGGDAITIDRKNRDPITDVLDCKFVMNCNKMPMFNDQSEGIWRRMIVLEWRTIPDAEVIRDFHKKLISEEISGIFNWALDGFHRVRKHGFQRQGVLKENLEAARVSIQPWLDFFEECVDYEKEEKLQGFTYTERLVDAYKDYCRRNNVDAFLYGHNLGLELRRWISKRLLGLGVDASAAKKQLERLKGRDSTAEAGTGRRREYYRGVTVRGEPSEQTAPAQPIKAKGLWTG